MSKESKLEECGTDETRKEEPLISLLRHYGAQKNGSWRSQNKERLLGYLLDYRSPNMKAQHLEKFISVSYTDGLLSRWGDKKTPTSLGFPQGFLTKSIDFLRFPMDF